MYPVSQAYKTAIRARTRTDSVTGVLTLKDGTVLPLQPQDLISGSLTLDNQCVTGEELAFGCAYMGQAALSLRTELDRYSFYGASLVLTYALQLPDGSWERVPLGCYTVAEAERRALYVSIKAYDNILALQTRFDGEALQGDAYTLLAALADRAGLTLGQTAQEIAGLSPCAGLVHRLTGEEFSTLRDAVSAIAQLLGGFAAADRAGRLVIRQFAVSPCAALDAAGRSEAAVSDFRCHYTAVRLETGDKTFTAAVPGEGLLMTISDMPLAEKGLDETRQQMADSLLATLQGLDYTPATVTMPGDPAFEPGDRITLPQPDDAAPEMLVTHFVWRYRGRQTLKSVGRNPYLGGSTDGNTQKLLRKVQASAETKRLTYYSFTNTADLTVQGSEVRAIEIAFAATEATSAIFLAQLLLDAAPDGDAPLTLTVRYYLNDALVENFMPQQRFLAGPHTMALFYPFPSVEADTVKRLSVRLYCAGGTVTIAKYGIKATVTGQGMVSELPWNGLITCEEELPGVPLAAHIYTIGAITDGGPTLQEGTQ